MTIEFEALTDVTITAPLSAVLYLYNDNDGHYSVAMADTEPVFAIDRANYDKIRAALRGYDQADTEEKP